MCKNCYFLHLLFDSVLRYEVLDRIFCHFGTFFALLPHQQSKKSKFWKTEKNTSRYHHFTQVYQKSWSHVLRFLEIWCVTNLICIFPFGLFLPFNPTNSLKNQNLKKWKKGLDISSFYKCVPKIMITWCTVPEIWCTMDRQKKWPGVDTEKKSWHW